MLSQAEFPTFDTSLSHVFRLQHHRLCPDGVRSLSGGECSPDEERADGETLLSVTDSDSDLDV